MVFGTPDVFPKLANMVHKVHGSQSQVTFVHVSRLTIATAHDSHCHKNRPYPLLTILTVISNARHKNQPQLEAIAVIRPCRQIINRLQFNTVTQIVHANRASIRNEHLLACTSQSACAQPETTLTLRTVRYDKVAPMNPSFLSTSKASHPAHCSVCLVQARQKARI